MYAYSIFIWSLNSRGDIAYSDAVDCVLYSAYNISMVAMNAPSFLCVLCSMSREEKGNPSTVTTEAVRPATEAHQASRSSPAAVARMRTLQDVQLEIDTERVKFHKAREQFEKALSGYQTALDASKTNPDNKVLSKKLADAKDLKDSYKCLMEVNAQRLASLETKRAQLQAAANAPTEHKGKLLFCFLNTYCALTVYYYVIYCRRLLFLSTKFPLTQCFLLYFLAYHIPVYRQVRRRNIITRIC